MKPAPATHVDVALATDSSGFVRRACPVCGRHFKVSAVGESSLLLSAFTGSITHANGAEVRVPGHRRCAYCGHQAAAEAFLTGPQRRWLEQCAHRLDVEVQVVRMRALDPHSALSIQDLPADGDEARPVEPDDMLQMPLFCCGEQLKLKADWVDEYFCPHCGQRQGHTC